MALAPGQRKRDRCNGDSICCSAQETQLTSLQLLTCRTYSQSFKPASPTKSSFASYSQGLSPATPIESTASHCPSLPSSPSPSVSPQDHRPKKEETCPCLPMFHRALRANHPCPARACLDLGRGPEATSYQERIRREEGARLVRQRLMSLPPPLLWCRWLFHCQGANSGQALT